VIVTDLEWGGGWKVGPVRNFDVLRGFMDRKDRVSSGLISVVLIFIKTFICAEDVVSETLSLQQEMYEKTYPFSSGRSWLIDPFFPELPQSPFI